MLIVDDNATNRRILEEVLTNWRMRPRAVSGGAEALAVLAEAAAAGEPYPLVLLDGHMPEMDGFTLAARIQADPKLSQATVLMLTSAGQPDDVERCRQLGVRAYLTKPVRQSELLETILSDAGRLAAARPPGGGRRGGRRGRPPDAARPGGRGQRRQPEAGPGPAGKAGARGRRSPTTAARRWRRWRNSHLMSC